MANDADRSLAQVPVISRLDENVVSKIAAGEVIQRPANALKELIENALDAGSTSVEILVKQGGLQLLQITDNGHGIRFEDLPVLCERFTTSKLREFKDLRHIATYGFRGEALASISHVSQLVVTSKTIYTDVSYRTSYLNGVLAPAIPGESNPKPVAGRQGTQIAVSNLFYNLPSRRHALKNANEEYLRIVDVVSRYAVHADGVAFSCKKVGEVSPAVSKSSKASVRETIQQIYGANIGQELVDLELEERAYGLNVIGLVTNANYHVKKATLLLFINHRAVESTSLRRAIDEVYATFLPKGTHPFLYLSLIIDAENVDVNVHPTKREVHFLHEDEVVSLICSGVRARLAKVDVSRSFRTQSVLPTPRPIETTVRTQDVHKIRPKPLEYKMMRTDARMQKITAMLPALSQSADSEIPHSDVDPMQMTYSINEKEVTDIKLFSIRQLKQDVRNSLNNSLTELFANHIFVGIADKLRRLACVQHGVKLYLIDYAAVSYELFYQIGLSEFANFGRIALANPLSINKLLEIACSSIGETIDMQEAVRLLCGKGEMLERYLAMEISEDGNLHAIPLLIRGYVPFMGKLPMLILGLVKNVNWTTEKECFDSLLKELALFYVPEPIEDSPSSNADRDNFLARSVETVLFPAFKKRLIATKTLLVEKRVIEIADLPKLYRIFERC